MSTHHPTIVRILRLAGVGALTLTATLGATSPGAPDASLAAGCADVTPRSVQQLSRAIGAALRPATADASKYGTDGAYAVAATNSRDLLKRAQDRVDAAYDKLQVSNPRVTTYAEGGEVKEHVRSTFEWISQAGHWSLVSAAYHRSTDAHDAFDGAVRALEMATGLYAEAGRCFMSGFPTS